MKTIEVVAAIIYESFKEGSGYTQRFLATERGYGDFKGGWEFPGGKIEEGESGEAAIVREIQEELAVKIDVDSFLCTVDYDYPNFHLTMHCFLCHVAHGEIQLLEHQDFRWLSENELKSVNWLPADVLVVENLLHFLKKPLA
ncbi:MAG: (deoxy)nucleoside triphosphate pyrophosphohydrolase [Fibrobacteraceae bacterium]|nr:(deoxy)nucleoside triphosphate pyrophosphohydrolase [Fibrobacteraceae bacterium]